MSSSRSPKKISHLSNRNGRYYASVRVPESLRGVVTQGRQTHIRRSLHTANEAEARRRLPHVVAEIKAEIERARREDDGRRKGEDPQDQNVAAKAAWWRNVLQAAEDDPEAPAHMVFGDKLDEMRGEPVDYEVDGDGHERPIFDPERLARASEFADLALGLRVPVQTELERFLADKARQRAGRALSARYESRIRRALKAFSLWLSDRPGGDNVMAVNKRVAGMYAEHLGETCNTAQTAVSLLTALSSYWRWMVQRGLVEDNPWVGQAPEERSSPADAEKRAFTDDELRRLLCGDTYSTLHDLMRLSALSGMRIEEIGRLTVADCADGVFNIRRAKTAAGVRKVPIHSALAPLLTRRTQGKPADAFLIEELKARSGGDRERTAKASERFTEYRRKLGVEEKGHERQRQSNVDFHSLRRWFATKAQHAGHMQETVARVMGHSVKGMTFGTYSDGASAAQMREVVEAVRLPEGAPADTTDGPRMGDGRWPSRGRKSASTQ